MATTMRDTTTPGPWFYNQSVDLEEWLPCLTTSPKEGQDNPAYADGRTGLICAFHPEHPPSPADARLLAAAKELLTEVKFLRDNFGVDVPTDWALKHIARVDALLARIAG